MVVKCQQNYGWKWKAEWLNNFYETTEININNTSIIEFNFFMFAIILPSVIFSNPNIFCIQEKNFFYFLLWICFLTFWYKPLLVLVFLNFDQWNVTQFLFCFHFTQTIFAVIMMDAKQIKLFIEISSFKTITSITCRTG